MKIFFELEPEEDGFPPVSVESMHGLPSSDGGYTLVNTPFFANDVAHGDRVVANSDGEVLIYQEVIEAGCYGAMSVILLDTDRRTEVEVLLQGYNTIVEYGEFGELQMFAVGVPVVGFDALAGELEALEGKGVLSYAELSLPPSE